MSNTFKRLTHDFCVMQESFNVLKSEQGIIHNELKHISSTLKEIKETLVYGLATDFQKYKTTQSEILKELSLKILKLEKELSLRTLKLETDLLNIQAAVSQTAEFAKSYNHTKAYMSGVLKVVLLSGGAISGFILSLILEYLKRN